MQVIILAGGKGKRLWPFSSEQLPKQFLSIDSAGTFLQQTARRYLSFVSPEDITVVTGQRYEQIAKEQLKMLGLEDSVLIEPEQRNTAPAVAYTMRYLLEKKHVDPDEICLISPSDHFITPVEKFIEAIQRGISLCEETPVLFGVWPSGPDEGYGYIQMDDFRLKRFYEKPSLDLAKKLLLEGNVLWNTGIFLARLGKFSRVFDSDLQSISIDRAYFEKCKEAIVLPLNCSWSDVGTWNRLFDHMEKDENQNVIRGNVKAVDCQNSLIFGNSKRMISTIGIQDVFVIDSPEALLICKKNCWKKN